MFVLTDLDGERHDEHADAEVGTGEARDEPVGDGAQLGVRQNAEDDQRVAEHRADGDRRQNAADQHGVRQRRRTCQTPVSLSRLSLLRTLRILLTVALFFFYVSSYSSSSSSQGWI